MGTRRASVDTSRHEEAAPERSLNLIEVAGSIKWFDVSKGFGFIVPDSGRADVLLHITFLRRDGFQTARRRAHRLSRSMQRSRGLQVFRILSLDESTATHPSQLPDARTHVR